MVLFDSGMGSYQALPRQIKVDLGVMAMKGYSTLPRSLELELHHLIQFSILSGTPFFCGVSGYNSSVGETVNIFQASGVKNEMRI